MNQVMHEEWRKNPLVYDSAKIRAAFQTSLTSNPSDAFAHAWYATFLKEVEKNFEEAEINYLKAIELSKLSNDPNELNHSMFPNGLGILIMDGVIAGIYSNSRLYEAQQVLLDGIANIGSEHSNFKWIKTSLIDCNRLIDNLPQ